MAIRNVNHVVSIMDIDLFQWWREVSTGFAVVANESSLQRQIERFARRLGFEHYSLGARGMVTLHDTARILSTYPAPLLDRYRQAGYLAIDPTVRIGARSRDVVVWSDTLFAKTPRFWDEARDFGLRAGLAQSTWGRGGLFTLLSLARERPAVTMAEAAELRPYLLMLAECASAKLQQLIDMEGARRYAQRLSPREIEVLKWSALGKTAFEASEQLGVTSATVQFHLQNAKRKLGVTTKIQATDHARRLGLID
ncbi:helix-turn-helix transcriptional regulator [Burkholderia plantarii]|uniref:helix-turn-helix transcriptional regulator n=1 Tax=Burkholderia plantarii TaxID=41899 RepID=UPI0018DD44D8|nr:LuxR family transcriptional regulator [Burkholderia plantarii]MBI0329421.1 LuxR family transcriptional regulator [Burkholderia plantarii]